MEVILLYFAEILDNIHLLSTIGLCIIGFGVLWTFLFTVIERQGLPEIVTKNMKYIFLVSLVTLACFILTPSNCKNDLDIQYIRKNGELERKVMKLEYALSKVGYEIKEEE